MCSGNGKAAKKQLNFLKAVCLLQFKVSEKRLVNMLSKTETFSLCQSKDAKEFVRYRPKGTNLFSVPNTIVLGQAKH